MAERQHCVSSQEAGKRLAPASSCTGSCKEGKPCSATLLNRPDADDRDPSLEFANVVDRTINYGLSRLTLGLSPAAIAEAYFDWLIHLAAAPGKQIQLWQKALRKWLRLAHYVATCAQSGGAEALLHRAAAARQAV